MIFITFGGFMKIYRFTREECARAKLPQTTCYGNEKRNMDTFDLISPSYPFLKKRPSLEISALNSFGCYWEMSKFFFLSIGDIFSFLTKVIKDNEEAGLHFCYTIYEIEIPDEVIRPFIGVGFYGCTDTKVEARISYQTLYHNCSKEDLPYMDDLLQFYNGNLWTGNIQYKKEYKAFLEQFPLKDGVYFAQRLPLYALFCFTPKELEKYSFSMESEKMDEKIKDWAHIVEEISSYYRVDYMDEINHIVGRDTDLKYYNLNFDRNVLFDYATPILKQENEAMKRLLQKNNTIV